MPFKYISKTFLRGLLVLLPLILTFFPLIYFFSWIDTVTREFILWLVPDFRYITGSGILIGLTMIFLLGLLMSSPPVRKLYSLLEIPLTNIPLIKSLYTAVKELTRYLAPSDDDKKAEKVVAVSIPDLPVQLIGFVMQDDLSKLPDKIGKDQRVAVYIPMSYQVGGFTLFMPESWLSPLEISIDKAMKNVLTGWMASEDRENTSK